MSHLSLSSHILAAFNITGEPQSLAGGRSLCFQVGEHVFKPADNDEESQWVAAFISQIIQQQLHRNSPYILPRPIPRVDDPYSFVFEGWTAWSLLPGQARAPERVMDILRTCRAFHDDIVKMKIEKPLFLSQPTNRFQEADLVAWDEKKLQDVANVSEEVYGWFHAELERLQSLKEPLPTDISQQLIHGDLTGNVLFDDSPGSLPGIIDMTFYWRPKLWAEAIIIADALAWHHQNADLVRSYGIDKLRLQLLVRAIQWRILAFCIDPEMSFVRAFVPTANYKGAVDIVEGFIAQFQKA